MNGDFSNRNNRLLWGVLLMLLFSAWAWRPSFKSFSPIDETWYGTTDQGDMVRFIVSSAGTQWAYFSLAFRVPTCPGQFEITTLASGPITNNQFSWYTENFSSTGQFTSESTAIGTYAFTNSLTPGCNVLLTRSGIWTAQAYTFVDVPTGYWAWEYIDRLYKAGITSGCGTNPLIFCPAATVTRDQMAIFLLRGEHGSSYMPPKATGLFEDVDPSYWASDWIEQLATEGITAGCNTNPKQFCPTDPVTRDQMAIFLLKSKHGPGYMPPAATGIFVDVPKDYWAAAWIEALAAEGVTVGCGTSPLKYCPGAPVTRDQMAVFLVKNFNLP